MIRTENYKFFSSFEKWNNLLEVLVATRSVNCLGRDEKVTLVDKRHHVPIIIR